MTGLYLWRGRVRPANPSSGPKRQLRLNKDPYGEEEKETFFDQAVDSPEDIETQERRQDMEERIIYADRAFLITFIWVLFLMGFPIAQMWVRYHGSEGLTDASFVTVITTTTASVFGFWALVGRYLFEPKNSAKQSATRNKKGGSN